MSSDEFVDETEAQENIESFLSEHGSEGLFVLYFRQFIYRSVLKEIKSDSTETTASSEQLYLDSGGDEILADKRDQMLERSEVWAVDLVEDMKSDSELRPVIESGDPEELDNDAVFEAMKRRLDSKLDEWSNQFEAILEEESA
jgi:hypothetical protein